VLGRRVDGAKSAGRVLATDHDRLFKDLLTTFFVEFLELFFPKLAALIEPASVEFLPNEVFSALGDRGKLVVDVLAKARFKEGAGATSPGAFFMIHVEHQSATQANFLERFFKYHLALLNKYGMPVYPIVVYSHDKPRKKQPNVYCVAFADGEVLRFTCRVVQLNRLPWKRFLESENPVASALMSKMNMEPKDRVRVKSECLRLMVTLRVDARRARLIQVFLDTYLELSEEEEAEVARSKALAELKPEEKDMLDEYMTRWERRGMAKGLEQGVKRGLRQGRKQGRQLGAVEALRAVLLDLVSVRFGAAQASSLSNRLELIDSVDQLRALNHRALTAKSLAELGL
jgi:hypothetical protein